MIFIDGGTGAGKTSLLKHLRAEYSQSVLVGTKLTTRPKRNTDNEWEFRFVNQIPEQYSKYTFTSVGYQYAIDENELLSTIKSGLVYAVICGDRRVIEALLALHAVGLYVYRAWTVPEFEALLASRGTLDPSEAQFRRDELSSTSGQYVEKVVFYNHVLLNLGSEPDLINQLSAILRLYGIHADVTR